jgi:NhaP-type Na+/H+ or K+/H+ antiporter
VSAVSSAAGSGVVLGIVLVFLAQQFGYLSLSTLLDAIVYFALGVILGGVIFGAIAGTIARRARARANASSTSTPPPSG